MILNIGKFHLHNIFLSLLVLFINGAIFQTFLLECGISENSVNIYCSVMQLVTMSIMLIFSGKIDKINNVIRVSGMLCLPALPLVALLAVMSFDFDVFGNVTLILLYGAGTVFTIAYSFIQILEYKLPYCIMNMTEYGNTMAISGIFIGIASTATSATLSFVQQSCGYFSVMQGVYLLSAIFVMAYVFSTVTMKNLSAEQRYKKSSNSVKINLFRYRPFYVLALPNLFRGFCLGTVNLIITIGYYTNRINANSASVCIALTYVIMMLGCVSYPFISKRMKEGKMILISSIGTFAALPMMFVHHSTAWFLVFYAIAYFFVTIINYAVPVEVTQIVDYDVVGHYSAWRLLINAMGIAIAGFVCTYLIDFLSPVGAMLLAGGLQLFSGMVYYWCSKTMTK